MALNQTDMYGDLYERVPAFLFVVMRTVALTIILLNAAVVFCLVCRKHKVPKIYGLQMICLCGSDIMAGTAVLVVSLIDHEWFRSGVVRCSFALGFFISSQSTTLYNVMAICINRFVILIRADKPRHHLTTTRVLVFSICALLTSFCFCALPFLKWASSQENFDDTGCSMESVFREHMESAMRVFFATFLAPLMITNILYGGLFIILRKKQRQITPSNQSVSEQSGTTTTKTIKGASNAANEEQPIGRLHQVVPGSSDNALELTNFIDQNKIVASASIYNGKQTTAIGLQNRVVPARNPRQPASYGQTDRTQPEKRGHQRKAFALLGLILLFLNIFTWPGVTVLMMESMIDSWSLSRGSKFPLFCTISLNSIINPILYTITRPVISGSISFWRTVQNGDNDTSDMEPRTGTEQKR